MYRFARIPIIVYAVLFASGCGGDDTASGPEQSAAAHLAVRARIVSPSALKSGAATQTTWDSLIVSVVYAADDTLRRALPLSMDEPLFTDTLAGLPAQDNVDLVAHTVNAGGTVIHRAAEQTIDLPAGALVSASVWLEPVRSSIYLAITDVPTTVATVGACFQTDVDTLCAQASRLPGITALSIDDVPDGASGILTLAGLDAAGDTLYATTLALTSHADGAATVWAEFSESPAGVALDLTLSAPMPMVVTGSMSGENGGADEQGPLIISEIMYMANGDEYVELYNPTATDTTFDTLFVEKDGTRRALIDVTVPSGGFYVIGRADSSWIDTTLVFLDLSSTSGNTLVIRTNQGVVVDWVAFATRDNDIEWPDISSARVSIVLDSLDVDPQYNNLGRFWQIALTPLGADSVMCGTPGRAGL